MARLLSTFVAISIFSSALIGACSSSSSNIAGGAGDAAAEAADSGDDNLDATVASDTAPPIVDAGADVIDKSKPCVSTFGTALNAGFGRIDGTVVAVIPPNDQACTAPNATHLIIEVMMGGAVYRMVVDVLSTGASPDVLFFEKDAPLVDGAWADGWHVGGDSGVDGGVLALDYVTDLNVQSTSFVAMKQADLVTKITSELDLGAKISVFATSGSTEPDSAHLVHRNLTNQDGAIVIRPDTATPHYLLLRFSEQSF